MAVVNLNKMASALCGENEKVRIRMVGDELQIRPTNRKSATNLPKGETLVDLRRKSQGGNPEAVRGMRFTLPKEMEMQVTRMYRAEERSHGWIALVEVSAADSAWVKLGTKPGEARPAGASVSDR